MGTQQVSVWRKGDPAVSSVRVDVITVETHKKKATPTQIPLEDGSIVSDHVIIQPNEVTIAFEMSNIDEGQPPVGERAKTAFADLSQLELKRELLEVMTTHELYKDMVLTAIDASNAAPFDGRLVATATFTQISRVKVGGGGGTPSGGSNAGAGAPNQGNGNASTGNSNPPTEKDESLLHEWTNGWSA